MSEKARRYIVNIKTGEKRIEEFDYTEPNLNIEMYDMRELVKILEQKNVLSAQDMTKIKKSITNTVKK